MSEVCKSKRTQIDIQSMLDKADGMQLVGPDNSSCKTSQTGASSTVDGYQVWKLQSQSECKHATPCQFIRPYLDSQQ